MKVKNSLNFRSTPLEIAINFTFFVVHFQSPPSITVTATSPPTTNNNNNTPPPPTSITKSVNLAGPFIKKDRRQISSRFNTKQGCEIESLPPLKGELIRKQKKCLVEHKKKKNWKLWRPCFVT